MALPEILIITDVKIRRALSSFVLIALLVFSIGIAVGYILGWKASEEATDAQNTTHAMINSCSERAIQTDDGKIYLERILQKQQKMFSCVHKSKQCWEHGLPRNYVVAHLGEKQITIDGRLDDEAWEEVPWSEQFEDIRGEAYPKPNCTTKFKMRWDDKNLYIGVYMQEQDLWATQVEHDSDVYEDVALEIFLNTDGFASGFSYKQLDINAHGALMDLAMYTSPYKSNFIQASNVTWHSNATKAVYYEGTLNKPGDIDRYWSAELAVPFKTLAEISARTQDAPEDKEVWFVEFGKSQPNFTVTNGTYTRGQHFYGNWWTWQPVYAYNMHLPDRWGLVQFRRNLQDANFHFPKWHMYKSLFDVYGALQKYKASTGFNTYALEALDVPAYVWFRSCVDIPVVNFGTKNSEFNITVQSMIMPGLAANISSNNEVKFFDRLR